MKPIEWLKNNCGLSHNQARQAILQGRVYVDNVLIKDLHARDFTEIKLDNHVYLLKPLILAVEDTKKKSKKADAVESFAVTEHVTKEEIELSNPDLEEKPKKKRSHHKHSET